MNTAPLLRQTVMLAVALGALVPTPARADSDTIDLEDWRDVGDAPPSAKPAAGEDNPQTPSHSERKAQGEAEHDDDRKTRRRPRRKSRRNKPRRRSKQTPKKTQGARTEPRTSAPATPTSPRRPVDRSVFTPPELAPPSSGDSSTNDRVPLNIAPAKPAPPVPTYEGDASPFGWEENTLEGTATLDGTVPGLKSMRIGGYLRPELVFIARPQSAPRDRYEYGVSTSRAGLLMGGEPFKDFFASIHVALGQKTIDLIDDVDTVDEDGDGIPDDIDTDTRSTAKINVNKAIVTWQPDKRFGITMGKRSVPTTAASLTSSNQIVFPRRVALDDEFTGDRDFGVFATGSFFKKRLIANVGVWNGTGRESEFIPDFGRGLMASWRVDVSPLRKFKFTDADTKRGKLRLSFGAGGTYRQVTEFDRVGAIGARKRDLRAGMSFRLAYRGLYVQTELLRKQVTDNLNDRPEVTTGYYAQASYFHLVRTFAVAPIARFSVLAEDQETMPQTTYSWEAGVALFPRARIKKPNRLRYVITYRKDRHPQTREPVHAAVTQLRMRW